MGEKISIRGTINRLELNETAEFDRTKYKVSVIRITCSQIKSDTNKSYKVTLGNEIITAKRVS